MTDKQRIFRFAPSPNGELHLGHAYSALLNLKLARASEGICLLRIEDIDTARCTPELEKQMLEDLEWIGFEWDEAPRRQSEHFDEYRASLETLSELGLLYPSTLSRGEIKRLIAEKKADGDPWPNDPDGSPHYPGTEREFDEAARNRILESGKPYTLRLNTGRAIRELSENLSWNEQSEDKPQKISARPEDWGDVVLARKDTPASYHLCCVVDDALQGITDVVRGRDLYQATSVHRLLQALLNLPQPDYFHHRLILDDNGKKLSKSTWSTSIRALREAGSSPHDIHEMLFSDEEVAQL